MVDAPKVVFSGAQLAFGEQDRDIRLAFERLGKDIEPLGVTSKEVFWTSVYPTTLPVANVVRAARFDFFADHGLQRARFCYSKDCHRWTRRWRWK